MAATAPLPEGAEVMGYPALATAVARRALAVVRGAAGGGPGLAQEAGSTEPEPQPEPEALGDGVELAALQQAAVAARS